MIVRRAMCVIARDPIAAVYLQFEHKQKIEHLTNDIYAYGLQQLQAHLRWSLTFLRQNVPFFIL